MLQVSPIISVGFETQKPISLEFVVMPLDPTLVHSDYPNGVRALAGSAHSGNIFLDAVGGGNSEIVLSYLREQTDSSSSASEAIRFHKDLRVRAVLYLSEIDPTAIELVSGYPIRTSRGNHRRNKCVFTPHGEPTRWEEYTHRFDVSTPLLGGVTIFASKEKISGPKRQPLEVQY